MILLISPITLLVVKFNSYNQYSPALLALLNLSFGWCSVSRPLRYKFRIAEIQNLRFSGYIVPEYPTLNRNGTPAR